MDVRQIGSGNIGFANVVRAVGWCPGFLVLFLDALKGLIPTYLALEIFHFSLFASTVIGLMAIIAHLYPVWLSFRGGKGVAAALGVSIALLKFWMILPLSAFLLAFLFSHIVSLSVFVAMGVLLLFVFIHPFYRQEWAFLLLLLGIILLILYRHRENIRRLIEGKELRLTSFHTKTGA